MTIPNTRSDREQAKFIVAENGNTALRVLQPPLSFGAAGNLSEDLNSTFEINNSLGYNTIGFYCTPPTGGVITFEATYDGINWEPTSVRGITSDTITSTIDTAGNFIGSIAANRSIRLRTSTAGSGVGTAMGCLHRDVSVIETIEFGYPPHKVGFATVRHHDAFSSAQTDFSLWTPPSGKAIVLTDLFVFAYGSTDGNLTIFMEDNTNGNVILNTEISVSVIGPWNFAHQYKLGIVGGVDESIKITTSTDIDCDVMTHGYQI